jgi:nucleotide-binding universal stress UspA family protein
MHVLVATDGSLDPTRTASFAVPLAGDGGKVTVLTVVEINRTMLRDLRALYGERSVKPPDQDAEYVGLRPDPSTGVSADWPGDDRMIGRYLDDQATARTAALVEALESAGAPGVDMLAREGEDPAAVIVETAERLAADVVVVGATGKGAFEVLLGSTGTKLARRAPCPVLIIRP